MGRPVAPLQLGHVRHRGVTLVVSVDDAVLTVLQTSGCPLGSVPQVGVDQAHWDGHHCKYDEQSQDGQGPARVLQVSFRSLDNTGGKAVSESTSTNARLNGKSVSVNSRKAGCVAVCCVNKCLHPRT